MPAQAPLLSEDDMLIMFCSFQATQRGLEAVDEIARRLRLDGVYGPLYTLFETRDSFKTAVENIANARSVSLAQPANFG